MRVYAGVDVLTGREIYLKQLVPAGPQARARAKRVREDLVRRVMEGRTPRTNASLRQLIERHLAVSEIEPRTKRALEGYLRRHIVPVLGGRPIGGVNAEVLDALYAELRALPLSLRWRPVLHHMAGGTCVRCTVPPACVQAVGGVDHSQDPLSDQRCI